MCGWRADWKCHSMTYTVPSFQAIRAALSARLRQPSQPPALFQKSRPGDHIRPPALCLLWSLPDHYSEPVAARADELGNHRGDSAPTATVHTDRGAGDVVRHLAPAIARGAPPGIPGNGREPPGAVYLTVSEAVGTRFHLRVLHELQRSRVRGRTPDMPRVL
jgi:hypothetical protein